MPDRLWPVVFIRVIKKDTVGLTLNRHNNTKRVLKTKET